MEPTQSTIQPDLNQSEPQEHVLNKVLKIMLVLLILILIGLGGFVFVQLSKKESTDITVPSLTISPTAGIKSEATPAVESDDPNDINIGSIEADLKDIENDIKGLQ